jgi:hypothetical protein
MIDSRSRRRRIASSLSGAGSAGTGWDVVVTGADSVRGGRRWRLRRRCGRRRLMRRGRRIGLRIRRRNLRRLLRANGARDDNAQRKRKQDNSLHGLTSFDHFSCDTSVQ